MVLFIKQLDSVRKSELSKEKQLKISVKVLNSNPVKVQCFAVAIYLVDLETVIFYRKRNSSKNKFDAVGIMSKTLSKI